MKNYYEAEWSIGTIDQRAGLFPLSLSVDAYVLPKLNAARVGIRHFAILFEPTMITYLMVDKEWRQASGTFFNRVKKNPARIEYLFERVNLSSRELLGVAKSIHRQSYAKFSNHELLNFYKQFQKKLARVYYYGLVLTFLDFKQNLYITELLMEIITSHNIKPEEQGMVFATLTTPTRRWDYTDAEEKLDALINIILKRPALTRLFSTKRSSDIFTKVSQSKDFFDSLCDFQKCYSWIDYGYEGPVLSIEDAVKMLQERLHHVGFPLQTVTNRHQTILAEQQKMIQQYQFTPNEQRWFKIGRDLAFSKSYRRMLQSHSYALLEPLLTELARRSNCSVDDWRMLTPQEARSLLLGKISLPEDINERRKLCVYGRSGEKLFLLTSNPAQALIRKIQKTTVDSKLKIFQGQVAYPGVVEGRAVLIQNPSDGKRLARHAIIIAPSLSPRMQMAIHRADAIVTDAGGLTCHAAVISRELKIPCIVGARGASEHINTGDRVLVDAQKGSVTLLSH